MRLAIASGMILRFAFLCDSSWGGRRWLLADGAADLETLRSSGTPSAWRPRATTTDEEVVFLAPLEFATARGRASHLFEFEYTWEVYKPAAARRYGYYTLPVLWGDRLCARIELRYDRPNGSLRVLGLWPEEPGIRRDPKFTNALGLGLVRLANFNGATTVDPAGLRSPTMQRRIAAAVQGARDAVSN